MNFVSTFLIVSFILASSAEASFNYIRCSNADGSIKREYNFPPKPDNLDGEAWIINGVKYKNESLQADDGSWYKKIKENELSKFRILESRNTSNPPGMARMAIYVYKTEITYPKDGKSEKVQARLICETHNGI